MILAVDNTATTQNWCAKVSHPKIGDVLVREMHDIDRKRVIKVCSLVDGVLRGTFPHEKLKQGFLDLDCESLAEKHTDFFYRGDVPESFVRDDWFRIYEIDGLGQVLVVESDEESDECEIGNTTFTLVVKSDVKFWSGVTVDTKHIDDIKVDMIESLFKLGATEEEPYY